MLFRSGSAYPVDRQFMARELGFAGVTPNSLDTVSDRDFLLDTLPGLPQVSAALGTGHGFKFAAWFGQQLAALACGEPAGADIAPFSFGRPSLHQPIDRASWMV